MFTEKTISSNCAFERYMLHYGGRKAKTNEQYIKGTIANLASRCFVENIPLSKELILSQLNTEWFEFENHRQAVVELWYTKIERFLVYMRDLSLTHIKGKGSVDVSILGETIPVKYHFSYIDAKGCFHLCKVKTKEPNISSWSSAKYENKVENNRELHLMYLAGKMLMPLSSIIPEIHFLTARYEKSKALEPTYELKSGKNIVSLVNFNNVAITHIEQIIKEINQTKDITSNPRNKTKSCSYNCSCSHTCTFCYEKQSSKSLSLEVIPSGIEIKKSTTITYNEEQKAIIDASKGVFRVNAGAGTGKTETIAERGSTLIKNGVRPKDILFVTFTNKGAAEALSRIALRCANSGLSLDEVSEITCSTFNSWGQSLISKCYRILGFANEPLVAEKKQIFNILKEVLDSMETIDCFDYCNPTINFKNASGVLVSALRTINLLKAKNAYTLSEISTALGTQDEDYATKIEKLYSEFNRRMYAENLIQYQDQLNLVFRIIEDFPDMIPKYEHIMVDEFQDCDSSQLQIVQFLAKNAKSLMVVGDDRQSIYGFRHTSPEFIINFQNFFPDTIDLPLTHNFRSSNEIVELGNAIASHNSVLIGKPLVAHREHGIKPSFYFSGDQFSNYERIVSGIKKDIQNGVPIEQICVMASTRDELNFLRDLLNKSKLPNIIAVSEYIHNNSLLNMFLEFCKYLKNPKDTFGLYQYLLLSTSKIFSVPSIDLDEFIHLKDASFQSVYANLENEEARLSFIYDLMHRCFKSEPALLSFENHLYEKKFTNSTELFNYIEQFVLYQDDTTIENTMRYKAVQLLTAHSSKGLEFSSCHVLLDKFEENESNPDETRRLLFVAATRAKDTLSFYLNEEKREKCSLYISELEEMIEQKILIRAC